MVTWLKMAKTKRLESQKVVPSGLGLGSVSWCLGKDSPFSLLGFFCVGLILVGPGENNLAAFRG